MKKIYFITYHYIRPIKKSKYPNLKGMELKKFQSQLNKLRKIYKILNINDLIEIFKNKKNLKKNSCVLTFDDGYKDNFKYVFPELKKRNIMGFFFPSVSSTENKSILNVNKIQFILEKEKSRIKILESILPHLSLNLKNKINTLKKNFKHNHPYDDKNTSFIKFILQSNLLGKKKQKVIDFLFKKLVATNKITFSKKLYLSKNEIIVMHKNGMYFGCHGTNHLRLNEISKKQMKFEINNNIKFLKKIGVFNKNWIMCYPHGCYNKSILDFLFKKNCFLGLTTKKGFERSNNFNPLKIKRIDCNEVDSILN